MTTNTPIPHRCAGLPENARAHLVALPQGDRVLTRIDVTTDGESWDCVTLATPFCGGCGGHVSFLRAVLRGEPVELPFSEPVVTR